MNNPLISVVMPARNEPPDRVAGTIQSILGSRRDGCKLEIVVVDDASDEALRVDLQEKEYAEADIRVYRLSQRGGVPRARNHGVRMARGEIVFITDAHVLFSEGWDRLVLDHIADNRILAATIRDTTSEFHGYGCSLTVPFMGTRWNRQPVPGDPPLVHIASSAGTVLTKACFERIGGYDEGMIVYGGAEPEFSIRAWLSGAEIVSVPSLEVHHRFKTRPEIERFLEVRKPTMAHNHLRFGLLYISELASLQMIRHFSNLYPEHFEEAVRLLNQSDVWQRKAALQKSLRYDFEWFVKRFGIKDQANQEILQ